jgi:hypothetical protein
MLPGHSDERGRLLLHLLSLGTLNVGEPIGYRPEYLNLPRYELGRRGGG